MSAPKTVWVVTSGSYSDYRVDAVFATKEAAEAFMQREAPNHRYDEFNDPAEFILWDEMPEARMVYFRQIRVTRPSGEVSEMYERDDQEHGANPSPELSVEVFDREGLTVFVNVTGWNRDVVEKALHDRVAQVRAEILGIA